MKRLISSLIFIVFVAIIEVNPSFAEGLTEKEKETIVKEAEKIIELRYNELLSQPQVGKQLSQIIDIEKFTKKSQQRLEKIIERDRRYIREIGAEYKEIKILNVWDIDVEKNGETIKVNLKAEVAKYYQYKNQQEIEKHPWLETRTHQFVFVPKGNDANSYELIDYLFEDELDHELNDTINFDFNLPTIEEMLEEQRKSGIIMEDSTNSLLSTQHTYNRSGAKLYAFTWYNRNNPDFRSFSNNCTNFISQAINRGGGVNMDWWGDLIWWYQGSQNTTSWSVAHDYAYYSRRNDDAGGLGAYYISNVKDLKIGSLVGYDFNNDGYFDHLGIVVNYDSNGEPLTAQHTPGDYDRPWRSINSNTKHYFLQTNDYWYSN